MHLNFKFSFISKLINHCAVFLRMITTNNQYTTDWQFIISYILLPLHSKNSTNRTLKMDQLKMAQVKMKQVKMAQMTNW